MVRGDDVIEVGKGVGEKFADIPFDCDFGIAEYRQNVIHVFELGFGHFENVIIWFR